MAIILNEDFFDEQDIEVDNDEDVHVIESTYSYMMQNKRPIKDLLSDFQCVAHIQLKSKYTPKDANRIYKLCNVLKNFLDAISYEIDASKIIIGSSQSRKDYHYNNPTVTGPNGRIEPYKNYIMRQTEDDKGINGIVNLVFGFKTLKQDYVIAQKSLTTILNIVNKIFKDTIDTFMLIWKTDTKDYNGTYFNVSDIEDYPASRLE